MQKQEKPKSENPKNRRDKKKEEDELVILFLFQILSDIKKKRVKRTKNLRKK